MNNIRFTCTSLVGTNKAGKLKKDADGYYTMIVGALNMYNSSGAYYVADDQVLQLFEESTQLMRRVKKGNLKGELGHPKTIGYTPEQFMSRCLNIWEDQVCCHHAELWLDSNLIRDDLGRPVIAIMSKVCPSGPYGHVLEKSLNNPKENVNFSIRSFSNDSFTNGRIVKMVKKIITFDYVTEPGISIAQKYSSPALESLEDMVFSRGQVERGMRALYSEAGVLQVGMESAALDAQELFTSMGWSMPDKPIWAQW